MQISEVKLMNGREEVDNNNDEARKSNMTKSVKRKKKEKIEKG